MSADEYLGRAIEATKAYRREVQRVDAELREERVARLSGPRRELGRLFTEAYESGVKFRDLKEAFGTSDYRTIRALMDEAATEPEVEEVTAPDTRITLAPECDPPLLMVNADGKVYEFMLHSIEDAVLLDSVEPLYVDDVRDATVELWDGVILREGADVSEDMKYAVQLVKDAGLL